MSKKVDKSPKKTNKEGGSFPTCINKQQARMVCLNEQCGEHPFFCSSCDDSSCEIAHQHDDKLVSVSYKEFIKRVLKERKPIESLGESIQSYKEVLEKLKEDVNEFIEKELATLEDIVKKAEQIPQEDNQLIEKLKNQQYEGLTGAQMDKLWTNCAQDPAKTQNQQQTAEFIKIKEEEVRGISEHFQHLNKMQIDNIPEDDEEDKKGKSKKTSAKTKK